MAAYQIRDFPTVRLTKRARASRCTPAGSAASSRKPGVLSRACAISLEVPSRTQGCSNHMDPTKPLVPKPRLEVLERLQAPPWLITRRYDSQPYVRVHMELQIPAGDTCSILIGWTDTRRYKRPEPRVVFLKCWSLKQVFSNMLGYSRLVHALLLALTFLDIVSSTAFPVSSNTLVARGPKKQRSAQKTSTKPGAHVVACKRSLMSRAVPNLEEHQRNIEQMKMAEQRGKMCCTMKCRSETGVWDYPAVTSEEWGNLSKCYKECMEMCGFPNRGLQRPRPT